MERVFRSPITEHSAEFFFFQGDGKKIVETYGARSTRLDRENFFIKSLPYLWPCKNVDLYNNVLLPGEREHETRREGAYYTHQTKIEKALDRNKIGETESVKKTSHFGVSDP